MVILNDKLMILLDRIVTFWHGILGLGCHILIWYFWIGVSRSDTVMLGSECHVPTRYSWIGVSRFDTVFLDRSVKSDTIILKEKYVELMEDTQSQRTQLPKWFGLEEWVLMCDLDTINLIRAYFIVIETCSCCLFLITC